MKAAETQKILIVDDKTENLFALEKILQQTGAEIIRAVSGNEALVASLHQEFAVAILDVQMPIMDGYELAEHLRSAEKTRRLPIIFLTAVYSDEAQIFKGYEAGAVDYITKPYRPELLLCKVGIFLQLDRQKRELLEKIEVERARRYLEDILLTITESVMVISRNTLIQTANGACFSLLGYEKDEILGMPLEKILSDEMCIDLIQGLGASQNKEFRNLETYLKDKAGQEIAVLLSGANLLTPDPENQGVVLVARDIRERKAAEVALSASETKYRTLFEGMPIGLYRTTPDGRFLDANDALVKMLAYPDRTSFLAVNAEQHYVDPDDRRRWKSLLDQKRVVKGFEFRLRCLDGHELWVSLSARYSHDALSKVTCCEGSIADISDRKRSAERIEHLNSILRAIRDVNELIVRERDRDRLIQKACNCLVSTRGFYSAWIVLTDAGRKVIKVSDAGTEPNHVQMYEILKEGKLPFCAEQALAQAKMVAFDGSTSKCSDCPMTHASKGQSLMAVKLQSGDKEFGVLMVSMPLHLADETEERGLISEVAEDIAFALNYLDLEAQRNEAQNALMESEERYRLIFETAAGLIVAVDQNGTIININQRVQDFLGYLRDELIGRSIEQIIHPDDMEKAKKFMLPYSRNGYSFEKEYRMIRKDGRVIDVMVNSAEMKDKAAKQYKYIWICQDVTERKSLEGQLRQAQKLEAIGTLAGGIAHDFNNILTAINGYTELALNQLPAESQIHSDLEQVLNSGRRAGEMVRQILTFSRQNQPEKHLISLSPLVKEGLKFLRAAIPTSIEIRQKIDPKAGKVLGDPTQVHQVLMNLCTNASHAMKDNAGVLTVELSDIELLEEFTVQHPLLKPGRHVRLRVADTGTGIAEETMDRIFEPYFTTKSVGEGTGMGLSVLLGIVQTHNGAVTVDSEMGKGTVFNVYFPAAVQKEMPVEEIGTGKAPGGSECILLVDDEETLCRLMQRILRHLGYETVVKTDVNEALECFRSDPQRFDLVITDLTMPKMTGVTLAGEIKAIQHQIPVILCTGAEQAVSGEKIAQAGIAAVIKKPITKTLLGNTVRQILDQVIQDGGRKN